jgi:hypothetical protein
MPIRPIKFDHEGQTIQAHLMYNFTDDSNGVTIILRNPIEGVKQTILFAYEDYEWKTTSEIVKLHPVTAKQIINCLKSVFGSDHILAVYDLLS